MRSRRPHPEDDDDWESDYDESDWRLTVLDDLDDDDALAGAAEWEDDTDLDDDEADDFDGEEDWQSRDDG